MILHSAQHTKDHQSDHIGDGGGDHHGLHVGDNVSTGHSGSQVRGVRQRRHLVAEIRTREDSAGSHSGAHAKTEADAHKGHTHGTHSTPGGTSGQGGDGADQHGGDEEDGGMDDLQAVVNHGGHHAGVDPHADEDTNDDQDTDGLEGLIDAVHHHLFNNIPLIAQIQGHQGCDAHAAEHRYMNRRLKDNDANCQQDNQSNQGDKGFQYFWHAAFSGFICLAHRIATNLSFITLHVLHFLIQRWIACGRSAWYRYAPPPSQSFTTQTSRCKSGRARRRAQISPQCVC